MNVIIALACLALAVLSLMGVGWASVVLAIWVIVAQIITLCLIENKAKLGR